MATITIASGQLRGRKIKTPGTAETRPLLSRLRKSLADILRPRLAGCRVLDLFGGSGAIAFELLSNGAGHAVVVEINRQTAELIRRNADGLGLADRVETYGADGVAALAGLADQGRRFDLVVVAPPYGLGLQQRALSELGKGLLLAWPGLVVVQRDRHEPLPAAPQNLPHVRTRTYGRTVFEFYQISLLDKKNHNI